MVSWREVVGSQLWQMTQKKSKKVSRMMTQSLLMRMQVVNLQKMIQISQEMMNLNHHNIRTMNLTQKLLIGKS